MDVMMTDIVRGAVVISVAGRDRGEYLAVVRTDADRAFVCNGRDRPLARPKAKNPVHLIVTGRSLPPDALRGNKALKKALARIRGEEGADRLGPSPEVSERQGR